MQPIIYSTEGSLVFISSNIILYEYADDSYIEETKSKATLAELTMSPCERQVCVIWQLVTIITYVINKILVNFAPAA